MKQLQLRVAFACGIAGAALAAAMPAQARQVSARLEIPAGPMGASLSELGRRTGTNILFASDAVQGLRSRPVRGEISAEQAVRLMIRGAPLEVVKDQTGAFVVRRSSAPAAVVPQPAAEGRMVRMAPAPAASASPATVSQDDRDTQIGEIVVTAQFREQRLQDAPLAITAVNADMLEARSQTQLSEVVQQAPNVDLRPAAGPFGNSISASIRGLGQVDFNGALEPGVGLYIDDVYYPRLTGANFDLLDLDRVEILRGPQGTLTGRNSEGGAIKFFSRKPDEEANGYVSATYGIRDRVNLRAAAGFKLTDNLFARVTGVFARQDGYVDRLDYNCVKGGGGQTAVVNGNCKVGDLGNVNYQALRGALRWLPADTIDLTVAGDYIDEKTNGAPEVLVAAFPSFAPVNTNAPDGTPFGPAFLCGRYCNFAVYSSPSTSFDTGSGTIPITGLQGSPDVRYKSWGVSANLVVDFSDSLQLTSITGFRKWNSSFSTDVDFSPANTLLSLTDLHNRFFSQEVRLNASLTGYADLTVGGYYSDEHIIQAGGQDIRYNAFPDGAGGFVAFPLQFLYREPVNTDSKAVFATLVIKPADRLTLTLGGRYTGEHKDYTFYRRNFDGVTINPFQDLIGSVYGVGYSGPDTFDVNGNGSTTDIVSALSGRPFNYDGHRFDYRVSVDYRFSPELLAYVTISTGFKGGGINPRPFSAPQAAPFNPESVTTYELGVKTDLFARRVRFNATAFLNDFKDQQINVLSCPDLDPSQFLCGAPRNAGNAEQWGLEFELSARPVQRLLIDASASYLNHRYKCVNPAVVGAAPGQCSSDKQLLSLLADQLHGWKWSAGVQYEALLGQGAGTLTPRIDVYHTLSLRPIDAVKGPDMLANTPTYTLANARLTWANEEKDLSVSLEVTNLFDTYNFVNKFDWRGQFNTMVTGQVGRPREWAVTVKKQF